MSYQNPHTAVDQPTPAKRSGPSRAVLISIACGTVVVLLAALFISRALTGGGAPDAPSGLSVNVKNGGVEAVWNGVDGADSYLLLRDGETIAYSGSDTKVLDRSAPEGEHNYSVIAVDDGKQSQASSESKVTVASSWGKYGPLVAEFPKLLPSAPDRTGWQDVACAWMIRSAQSELGSDSDGSGTLVNKARLACDSSSVGDFHVVWQVSDQAAEIAMSDLSKEGLTPVTWRHGTGYYDVERNELDLRVDSPKNTMIYMTKDGASKEDLLKLANSMPLD